MSAAHASPLRAPRGRKPALRGEARLVEVLGSLDRLLKERSITEVTVEDIAAGAGMSRSAFYFYFASKHDALAAAVTTVQQEMITAAAPFLEGQGDLRARLQSTFRGVGEVFLEHRHLIAAVMQASAIDPQVQQVHDQWIEGFIPDIAARLRRDRAAGLALAGPPLEPLVRALLWLNEHTYAHEVTQPKPDLDRATEIIGTVWLRTLYGDRHTPNR